MKNCRKHHIFFQSQFVILCILYSLDSKTHVLLSKQGFGMGPYIRRDLTDFNGVLLSKVKVLHGVWGLTFEGGLTFETIQY